MLTGDLFLTKEVLYQLSYNSKDGAVNQIRTGDLFLTKEVLYQLSYNSDHATSFCLETNHFNYKMFSTRIFCFLFSR